MGNTTEEKSHKSAAASCPNDAIVRRIDDLKKPENEHLVDFWIHDKAAAMKDGTIAYTQYHDFGGGSLILREALDSSHPESPNGLVKRAKEMSA